MRNRDGTLFTASVDKNKNLGKVFTENDGLQMAFAIVDYNGWEYNYEDVY